MRNIENQCVGCETCTLGSGCSLLHVEVDTCDICDDTAECSLDGKDYCVECANEYLNELFNELSITEKAEAMGVSYTPLA